MNNIIQLLFPNKHIYYSILIIECYGKYSIFKFSAISGSITEYPNIEYFVTNRNIKKGEELTISYVSPETNYQDRKNELEFAYNIVCECGLCELQRGEEIRGGGEEEEER